MNKHLKILLATLICIFFKNNSFATSGVYLAKGDLKLNEAHRRRSCIQLDTGRHQNIIIKDTTKQKADTSRLRNNVLKGVTIKGKRVLLVQNVDRSIVTVENNRLFLGSNLEEVLEKIPGVTIDGNNHLIVNGNGSVKFQINGRDIPISGNSISSFLKSIQSSAIKSVEIINPSAKSDAQSSAKILNINTVQQTTDGFTLSPGLTYSQGKYARTGINLFSQAKVKKFTFQLLSFADLSNEYSTEKSSRIFRNTTNFINESKALNRKRSYLNKIDINYNFDKKNILGLSFYNTQSNQKNSTNSFFEFRNNTSPDSSYLNNSLGKQNLSYSIYSGYFKHAFDEDEEYISFNVDVNRATNRQNYLFTNQSIYSTVDSIGTRLDQSTHSNSSLWVPSVYINYSKPLIKSTGRLDLGLKYTSTKDHEYYDGQNDLNNAYSYNESVAAGYVSFLYDKKAFSFQGGFRAENSSTKGEINNNSVTDKKYFNLFPSISLQRKFHNDDYIVSVNYRKRIIRPTFLALSPFLYFTSPYEAFRGDATLSPTLIDDFNASFTIKGVYINANYSSMHNVISQLPIIDDSLTTITNQYINIGAEHYRSINVSYPFNIKTVSLTPSVNAESASSHLTINSQNLLKNTSDISFNLNGVYRCDKTSRFEIRSFYVPKVITVSSTINHKSGVTIRYIKTFLDGNLSMRAAVEDIFNANKESGSNNFGGYVGTFSNFYDNRRASLSLTYSLRKGKRVSINAPGQENSDTNERIKN
ncbi:Outer membrane protein beta-barrel family protein [Mucilaginibacter gossypiicola]|uniref:Outer membrane protein beta-barrel family protein n=1 Tax=Mucilaginibacter gossypiicola TaxID=551995 RepID=A0A1H8TKI6_9SPHI|nr:outer membrane beta-barrel family protein [Mucilaginibacter gossypiicola]SEO91580.1 Outer membrane protein beta-barrel family protein [Mucilaginibacter gossypiicola]